MIQTIFTKFIKSKKAESQLWAPDTMLFWILYGIVLGFVAVFFVIIVAKTGSEQATIYGNLESMYLSQRFLKSPECFSYKYDGILMVNTIDAKKFTSEQINSCYDPKNLEMAAFRITLSSTLIKSFEPVMTKNWNTNREYAQKPAPYNVLVYSDGKFYNGELTIEMQNI